MILPSKHLSQDRALLTIGAHLLALLSYPMTVSALWEEISRAKGARAGLAPALRYDAYVLTLDLLFLVGAIELRQGLLSRKTP